MSICSSTCEYPVFPVPLIEEAVFFLMSMFGTIVKCQAAVAVQVDFWVLCSITLVYMSDFAPIAVSVTLTVV